MMAGKGLVLTNSQERALAWLGARNQGYLDKHGYMVAEGEITKAYLGVTWLRLMVKGLIASSDGVHIILTAGGEEYLRVKGLSHGK